MYKALARTAREPRRHLAVRHLAVRHLAVRHLAVRAWLCEHGCAKAFGRARTTALSHGVGLAYRSCYVARADLQSKDILYCRLDGSTNRVQRQIDIKQFNQPGSALSVFLCSTRAGGFRPVMPITTRSAARAAAAVAARPSLADLPDDLVVRLPLKQTFPVVPSMLSPLLSPCCLR